MTASRRSDPIPDERPLASIAIGGTLDPEALAALLRACDRAAASLLPDGAIPDEIDIIELLSQKKKASLVLHSRKVTGGGDLATLERFCQRADLTYRRVTRGGAMADTTESFWKPGMILPHKFQINARTGDILYPMTFLLALRNQKVNLNEWVLSFQDNFPTEIPPLVLTS
ncbi:hypothetical protein SAMN05444156_0191 [Verrucomicrobium sp. GAS474]|uniref:hypothetical protein n=1 Tax=Verrucomicrobium sp. GAS474 TaxID=1882831 RepID=UPI00087C92A7|nr:hypothetical protein [Verrucomicrobium sp. GAS474]SDT86449.1 hypothetical protein SAMN05444156_0191 [Verrucomicrobium sp. GAS474]